jgi:ABC-type multidrug transport system ATPase subunit
MTNPETIIQFKDVSKRYSRESAPALTNINLAIQHPQKVGLIGANGSGKTTLLRLMLNLLKPDSGQIRIMGSSDLETIKRHIGFVSEYQQGLENFSPEETLKLSGRMASVAPGRISERTESLLRWLKVDSRKKDLIGSFSKGMRQRLFLAVALFHEPKILLLDEPMSGLDPTGQIEFRKLLQELDQYTIIYASHQLSELEDICDRIIFFHEGQLVDDINRSDFLEDIYIIDTDPKIRTILESFPQVKIYNERQTPQLYQVEILTNPSIFQEILGRCSHHQIKIHHLRSRSFLEEIYKKYVR